MGQIYRSSVDIIGSGWSDTTMTNRDAAVSGWADTTISNASGYFEGGGAVSGYFQYYVDNQDHSATAVSGWADSTMDNRDASISGWASNSFASSADVLANSASGVAISGWADSTMDSRDASISGWADNTFGNKLRYLTFSLIDKDTAVATATSIGGDFTVPFAGTIVQDDAKPHQFAATTDTAGTTSTMTVDVNLNGSTIMTTNKLDIETTEKSSATAATQPDVTTTAVSAGDVLTFDVDAVHTTPANGLKVYIAIKES